jgi:hypothetical protein
MEEQVAALLVAQNKTILEGIAALKSVVPRLESLENKVQQVLSSDSVKQPPSSASAETRAMVESESASFRSISRPFPQNFSRGEHGDSPLMSRSLRQDSFSILRDPNIKMEMLRQTTELSDLLSKRRWRTTEEFQQQQPASHLSMLKHQRAVYDNEPDRVIYNGTQECEYTGKKAVTALSQSGVRLSCSNTPLGRPTDADFERAVIRKVLGLDKSPSQVGSISGNYKRPLKAIIIAGMETAEEEPFCDHKNVKGLKFSKCWAGGVLGRHIIRHRTVSPQQNNNN